ncbi:MAG: hypothetical protein HZRFUVUK_000456 [Candidatus Fervidibacterota bacterium]|jgi:hypothetical protein
MRNNELRLTQLNRLFFIGSFLIPLSVYMWTLAPTVSFGGDCGDFITGSALMALVHPSGYPLHLLFSKLLTIVVPFGDISFRVNLLSALFGAASCTVAYCIVTDLTGASLVAFITAMSLGFSYVFWSQAVIAEVYTGSVFFTLLPLLLLIKLLKTADKRYLYGLWLAIGLSACHHLSALMSAPAILIALLAFPKKLRLKWIDLLIASVFFLLPSAQYAYIPLRARRATIHRYWHDGYRFPDPAKSFEGFKFYVTGQMYRTKMMSIPMRRLPERFFYWVKVGMAQLWLVFLLVPAGCVALAFISPSVLIASIGGLLAQLFFYLRYDVPDIVYFYLPSWAVCACVGGVGAGCIWETVRQFGARNRFSSILLLAFVAILISTTLSQAVIAYPLASMRGDRLAKDMAEDILANLPKGAKLLVMSDDLLFAIWVVQRVEGKRMDVELFSYPNDERWADEMAWKHVKNFIGKGLVYVTFVSPSSRRWFLHPHGWVAMVSEKPPVRVLGKSLPPLNALMDAPCARLVELKLHRGRTHPEMFVAFTCIWYVLDPSQLKEARVLWLLRMKNTDIAYPPVKDVGGNKRPFWVAEAHELIPSGVAVASGDTVAVDYCLPADIDILPGKYELLVAVVHKRELEGLKLSDGKELKRRFWKKLRVVGECEILMR